MRQLNTNFIYERSTERYHGLKKNDDNDAKQKKRQKARRWSGENGNLKAIKGSVRPDDLVNTIDLMNNDGRRDQTKKKKKQKNRNTIRQCTITMTFVVCSNTVIDGRRSIDFPTKLQV